jgi:hypothetical protein
MTLPFIRLTDPKSGRPKHIDISGVVSIGPEYDDPNTTVLICEGVDGENVFTFVVQEDPDTVMSLVAEKLEEIGKE